MWREVNSLLHTHTITDVTAKYKRLKVSAVLINIDISPPEYFSELSPWLPYALKEPEGKEKEGKLLEELIAEFVRGCKLADWRIYQIFYLLWNVFEHCTIVCDCDVIVFELCSIDHLTQ